jgi:CubicO group peptidase (beta-lactamase class C family)
MIRPLFLLTLSSILAARPERVDAQLLQTKLDTYMSARESLGQFSGAVLVARNGEVLLSRGYGYSDIASRKRTTAETQFRAASITKQFTAMAVLRLREAGRLSLTDPICRWIARCPEAWKSVTIAHLIHHSSGIPDYEEALDLGSPKYNKFMQSQSNALDILDSARVKPLDFAPGTRFHYSNTGYILLSQIIEKASGMSYPDYMKSKIFSPAGLKNTGILSPTGSAPRLATGYMSAGDPPLEAIVAGIPFLESKAEPVPFIDVSGIHGDAAMYTTVGDLNRWLTFLSGDSFLNASLRREYFAPGLASGGATPADGYAFGWIIGNALGTTLRYHTGLLPGFVSRIEEYPDSGLVVIVMTNSDFFRVSRIARDLAAASLGMPYDVPRSHHIVKLDSAVTAAFVGEYALANGTRANVSVGDRFLELQVPGRFTAGLLAESDSLFYAPFFEGTVRFDRDSAGKVTALTMHYDGTDKVATRVTSFP